MAAAAVLEFTLGQRQPDLENRRGRIVAHGARFRHLATGAAQCRELAFALLDPAERRQRHRPSVVPHRLHDRQVHRRSRLVEHLLPHPEAHHHVVGHGVEAIEQVGERAHHFQRHLARHVAGRRQRHLAPPLEHGRIGQEVVVVGPIDGIEPAATGLLDVGEVDRDRLLVGGGRLGIVAQADVDVAGHVHEVAGPRHQVAQHVGRGQRLLRRGRGLPGVDREVQRGRVLRFQRQHRGEGLGDLGRAGLHLPVGRPQVPGAQVHQRLGEERAHVGVVGVRAPDLAHHGRVGLVERFAIGRRGPGVPVVERLDQHPLQRRSLRQPAHRLRQGGARLLDRLPGHLGIVDVGTPGVGDAPPGHRAVGIRGRGLRERKDGLGVVEAVAERESLVEPALGLARCRRDGEVSGALSAEPLWRSGLGGGDHRQRGDDQAEQAVAVSVHDDLRWLDDGKKVDVYDPL